MKKLFIIGFLLMSFNSYSQKMGVEYYIKANTPISLSKQCHITMMQTVLDGDRVAFAKLKENGCMMLFGKSTKGEVSVYLYKREGVGYAKYRIKGTTDNFVWLTDEAVIPVN